MASASSIADWDALQRSIAGEVVLAEAAAYELVRKPAMARFWDVRPQAVVRCRTPEDVVETVALARRSRIGLAVRSGGHCFGGESSTPGVLIDVGPMDGVAISDGLATVGAGARLGDLYDALDGQGRTIAAGCGPSVGIAGLTLGGGLGLLGRTYGLTSDQLVAAQVVLADGRVVDCDEHRHADLFWALRGAGGGRFGVVTGLVCGRARLRRRRASSCAGRSGRRRRSSPRGRTGPPTRRTRSRRACCSPPALSPTTR